MRKRKDEDGNADATGGTRFIFRCRLRFALARTLSYLFLFLTYYVGASCADTLSPGEGVGPSLLGVLPEF